MRVYAEIILASPDVRVIKCISEEAAMIAWFMDPKMLDCPQVRSHVMHVPMHERCMCNVCMRDVCMRGVCLRNKCMRTACLRDVCMRDICMDDV